MQPDQALRIIRSLANGLDPQTSRELPPGTPFEQPAVIRALFAAARALETEATSTPAAPIVPATPAAPIVPAIPPAPAVPAAPDAPAPRQANLPAIGVSAAWDNRPANAGKAWAREEDARLCDGFDRGVSLDVLAQIHARTLASIQSRLEKLGKLTLAEPAAPTST